MRIEPLGSKVVVSIGNGPLLEDGGRGTMQVSEGDRVLFSSYSGTEIDVDGDTLLIMNEADILAVLP